MKNIPAISQTYERNIPRSGAMKCDARIFADKSMNIESSAVNQLKNAASIDPHAIVFATPDIHCGFGVPIGCVFASEKYIVPCAVGYDINCGMRMLRAPVRTQDVPVKRYADALARVIPRGEGKKNITCDSATLTAVLEEGMKALPRVRKYDARVADVWDDSICQNDIHCTEEEGSLRGNISAVSSRAIKRGKSQLATLGGGNHFVEIQEVTNIYNAECARAWGLFPGQLTIMIHSGSRGLGHQIGGEYMKEAKEWCARNGEKTPDNSIAWFHTESKEAQKYIGAHNAAANYAYMNRALMAWLCRYALQKYADVSYEMTAVYDVSHNCVKKERHDGRNLWVHRKGATRAFPPQRMKNTLFQYTGQPVLIPGSMGTASYVLAGVAARTDALNSVNHGAGRTMSRTEAAGKKKKGKWVRQPAVTDAEFANSMKDVYLVCDSRQSVREEAPAAYKDIDTVIKVVEDAGLAIPVARMRPWAVLKG